MERLLLNNEVYCPSPLLFNDPFDCLFPLSDADITDESIQTILKFQTHLGNPGAVPEEVAEAIKVMLLDSWDRGGRKWKDWQAAFLVAVRTRLARTGVVCFSELPDCILMWGHYADGHRGVCVQFERSVLAGIVGTLGKVRYSLGYPSLNDYARRLCKPKDDFFILTEEYRLFSVVVEDWRLFGVRAVVTLSGRGRPIDRRAS